MSDHVTREAALKYIEKYEAEFLQKAGDVAKEHYLKLVGDSDYILQKKYGRLTQWNYSRSEKAMERKKTIKKEDESIEYLKECFSQLKKKVDLDDYELIEKILTITDKFKEDLLNKALASHDKEMEKLTERMKQIEDKKRITLGIIERVKN